MNDFRNALKATIAAQIADKTEQLVTRNRDPLDELRGMQEAILAYRHCLDLVDEAWRSMGNME